MQVVTKIFFIFFRVKNPGLKSMVLRKFIKIKSFITVYSFRSKTSQVSNCMQ